MSIESIFFNNTLFSFYISRYLDINCFVLVLVPPTKWLYYLGARVSSMLFILLSLFWCSSCSYNYWGIQFTLIFSLSKMILLATSYFPFIFICVNNQQLGLRTASKLINSSCLTSSRCCYCFHLSWTALPASVSIRVYITQGTHSRTMPELKVWTLQCL